MSNSIDIVVETINEKINPIETKIVNNQIEIIIEADQLVPSFQFLKDNSIEAIPAEGSAIKELVDELPFQITDEDLQNGTE